MQRQAGGRAGSTRRGLICRSMLHEGRKMYTGKTVSPPKKGACTGPFAIEQAARAGRAGQPARRSVAVCAVTVRKGQKRAGGPPATHTACHGRRQSHSWHRARNALLQTQADVASTRAYPPLHAPPYPRPLTPRRPTTANRPKASTSCTWTTSQRTSSWTCWSAAPTPSSGSTRATSRSSPLPAAPWQ
jgi:hypothetical protein